MPAGSDDVVTVKADGWTVMDTAAVAEVDALSVAFTVTFAVPAAVGVPDIVPPAERVSPTGSDPLETDHV